MYYPACGGNHVCNMISLCKEFSPRLEHDGNYPQWFLEQYKNYDYTMRWPEHVNAHFRNDLPHINEIYEVYTKEELRNTDRKNIFQGHYENYQQAVPKQIIRDMGAYVGIVFTYPKENSIPSQRLHKMGFYQPYTNYSFPMRISDGFRFLLIDENNGFQFETERLFTEEGSHYLRDMLKTHFDIDLPVEADEMHAIWLKWIDYILTFEGELPKDMTGQDLTQMDKSQ